MKNLSDDTLSSLNNMRKLRRRPKGHAYKECVCSVKEELKGLITTEVWDCESIRKKLELCIYPLDPGKHLKAIINVANGH